ncbi:hypothetical protein GGR57DRAFT_520366 [Xylariaceae sp. FL1272]|nr:hypothetical protein GGR57DRAFT_520366 [Xylariaceae sp. FL1272]
MVQISFLVAAALATVISPAQAAFGNGWDDRSETSWITHFSTNIVVPKAPSPQQDWLVLWPALQSPKALMQPILGSYNSPPCSAGNGQWCSFTYTLLLPENTVKQGPTLAPVGPGTHLHIAIQHIPSIQGYKQTIRRGGASGNVISHRSDKNVGQAHRAEFYVECDLQFSRPTPRHVYTDTTIVFAEPVHDFKGHAGVHKNVELSGFSSPDGGKTWHIKKLVVKQGDCTPEGQAQSIFALGSGAKTGGNSTDT